MQIKIKTPAKINLTLEIVNKRPDGFHNIRSINAHSLQEIRTLIPESVLKKHKDKSCKDVEDFIRKNIERTAQSIFRISKDLYEIKAEFSIYDKLIKGEEKVSKRLYNIRDVIMIQ